MFQLELTALKPIRQFFPDGLFNDTWPGQPDFGHIIVRYVPDKKCIESKSLKLYLYSFRNTNTFHEESVNTILDAVVKTCSPRRAEVIGRFRPRGGIAINVKATYGDKIDE